MSEDNEQSKKLKILLEEYKDISRVRTNDDTLALAITGITLPVVTVFYGASIQFKGTSFVLVPASIAILIFWFLFYNKLEQHANTRLERLEQIEYDLISLGHLKTGEETYLMHYKLMKEEAKGYKIMTYVSVC